jgi:hypothetical protein
MQLVSECLKPFGFTVMEQGKNKICLQKNQVERIKKQKSIGTTIKRDREK